MNTQTTFMSKAGYTAVRNLNLFRIDKFLKDVHLETEHLIKKCKHEQGEIFEYWANFCFVMATLFSPVLLAIKQDFKNISYDLRTIMAPVTVAWVLLVLVVFLNYRIIVKYKL